MLAKIFLLPFSLLYHFITFIRNRTYDSGLKKSVSFELPVVSVGNLTVGGAGKTPHIEYLIRLLKPSYKLATLSRGYGRKTNGFLVAEKGITAKQIGDEPMQFFQKYGDEVLVTVCEERLFGIPSILMEEPDTQVVLLDDAYQHRPVKPQINILLSDYRRPFYTDMLLPAGRLREARTGAKRADFIIISKCPSTLQADEMLTIKNKALSFAKPDTPVFFTYFDYGNPIQFSGISRPFSKKIVLVTGIANTAYLKKYIEAHFELQEHLEFPDHFNYSKASIEKIKTTFSKFGAEAVILTTEKDATKLGEDEWGESLKELPIFSLPIEVKFLAEGEGKFNQQVTEKIIEVIGSTED